MANFTTNENLYKWSPTDTKTETITEMAKNADKLEAKFVEVDNALSVNTAKFLEVDTALGEKSTNARVEATEVRITETETDIATLETNLGTTNTNVSSNTSEIVYALQSAAKNKTFATINGRFEELESDVSLKANRTQEAWITPTLLNGATGTIQYRKNQFGIVEFRGTLTAPAGSVFMTMPVGYRPSADTHLPVPQPSATNTLIALKFFAVGASYVNFPYGTSTADMVSAKFPTT